MSCSLLVGEIDVNPIVNGDEAEGHGVGMWVGLLKGMRI